MSAVICLANLGTDAEGNTIPVVPSSWDLGIEASGWISVYPLGREARPDIWFFARLMASDAGEGAFIAVGPAAVIRELTTRVSQSWTIADLRADNGAVATAIKAAWKDERPRDELGNVVAGSELVTLYGSPAGYGAHDDLESTSTVPA